MHLMIQMGKIKPVYCNFLLFSKFIDTRAVENGMTLDAMQILEAFAKDSAL